MDSKIGLIIQLNGVILITVLSFCLRRSLQLTALKYWTMAWLCLSFALICLQLAFNYEEFGAFLFTYYFLGQYIFGFMLVAGCRSLDGSYELQSRAELGMIPFVVLSIVLPHIATEFNDVLNVHSAVLGGFYGVALFFLRRARQDNFGWRVMHVSLALLTINFIVSAVVISARNLAVVTVEFLTYSSIIDLVLQTGLGVGMVVVLLEKVLGDARNTTERLLSTKEQLEQLIHTDPLTAAFTRHAFYGFVRKHGENASESSGCVGFFDIDDLKAINDCFGHAAGDQAIRAVVRSIRELVRAEDLIYRWGGDEFFVIMVSMDSDLAERRMERLDALLEQVYIDGLGDSIKVSVSWGFTNFDRPDGLEDAIRVADSVMYRRKHLRKRSPAATIEFFDAHSVKPAEIVP